MNGRRTLLRSLAATCLLAAAPAAFAAYPDKPIRLIVPFPAGGATDVVARLLGARLSQSLQQTVVVENRTGAGGNIGAGVVAKAAPDGYTVLIASPAEVAINEYLYASMSYDPAKDLVPVAKLAAAPLVLVVNSQSPDVSVAALVRRLKSNPEGASFASSGTGGPQHLAGELFRLLSNTQLTHVPYKGGAPAMTDLLGGRVGMFFAGLPPALPHIQAGKLRVLGVSTAQRSALLPQAPTVAEQGLPGFDIENWQGAFVPAGTPAAVVDLLARSIGEISSDKAFAQQLQAQGAAPAFLEPKAFAAFVAAERRKFAKLVKDSGAKAD